MTDYISREAAIESLVNYYNSMEDFAGYNTPKKNAVGECIERLKTDIPAADVRPKWKSVRQYTPAPGRYLTACKSMTNPPSYYLRILSYTDNLESVDEYDFEGENIPGWYEFDREYGYYSCDNVEWFMLLPPEPPNCGAKMEVEK